MSPIFRFGFRFFTIFIRTLCLRLKRDRYIKYIPQHLCLLEWISRITLNVSIFLSTLIPRSRTRAIKNQNPSIFYAGYECMFVVWHIHIYLLWADRDGSNKSKTIANYQPTRGQHSTSQPPGYCFLQSFQIIGVYDFS